ncbi:penicillin-binding protein [Cellulomonas aerilata]|uniref:penicillin-binding protein n=1 Tax=Cellulomonas aerilata TaxID=515326 RepID=UPI0011BF4558|nr:penicillin-binding protein [Cellulomonas aerilata]
MKERQRTVGRRQVLGYPQWRRTGIRRWLPSWRLVLGSLLTLGFLGIGAVAVAYAMTTIPEPDEFTQAQTTTVYYADGATVMGTFATQTREIVDIATLPEHVGHAVVASEDRTFYENAGISPTGMTRALINNLRGGATQGGSTITQQYAERYYAGQTTTDYVGKAKEALLAVKIGQSEDKEEVLGNYLNTIYLGRGTYGIQAASQAYFGVNAADLTVSQAAMIAGIIPSPSNWDPLVDPERAEQRWNRVLDLMVEDGWITEADRAAQVFPETIPLSTGQTYAGPQGYLLDMVRRELRDRASFTDEQIDTAGLSVVTTIEKPLQDAAVTSAAALMDGTLAGEAPAPNLRASIVSVDPADGAIVALYGGPDFISQSFNSATQGEAQGGSTFKPFTLVGALENGIPLTKRYPGFSPMPLPGWERPGLRNFGNQSFGSIDLVQATEDSVNTVYAQLNIEIGPEKTAQVAQRAGITTPVEVNAANVLGSSTVHPLDMASAYATFAAQGFHSTPFIVRQATYIIDDSVAYQGAGAREQVFSPEVVADATYAMTRVVTSGSGSRWVGPLDRPIAGKTGTSNENRSAWFVGFTPRISTAVGFYQPPADGTPGQETITPFGRGVREVTGGTWPSALWAQYMEQVFAVEKYAPADEFPERANVNRRSATSTPTPTATPTPTPTPTETAPPQPQTIAVPGGLAGRTRADAEAALVNAGLTANVTEQPSDTVPAGRVISADPAGEVPAGTAVTLVVSSGPAAPPATPTPAATTGAAAPAVPPPG